MTQPMLNPGVLAISLLFLAAVAVSHWILYRKAERLRKATDTEGLANQLAKQSLEKEKAQTANRAKSQLLAHVSHDIRTPISGLLGMLELLSQTDLSRTARGYVEHASRSGHELLFLVNDILDYSKVEAGKLELEIIDFNLLQTIDEVVALFSPEAARKGVRISYNTEPAVPTFVQGDPSRLRQILSNLITNALKYTHKGSITLTISLVFEGNAPHPIRFEVQDTGIGIAEADQKNIFESFFQADRSASRSHCGYGLGLAICRQLVDHMGGEIGLRSKPGAGSTFWFNLPLERAVEITTVEGAQSETHCARILVASDNDINRKILQMQLADWRYPCGSAADEQGTVERLRSAAAAHRPYHLAILDTMKSFEKVLQLAHRIKGDPAIAGVRLVILTSTGMLGDAKASRQAGILAYLTKPVSSSQLYDCIQAVLLVPADRTPLQLITRHTLAEAQPKLFGRVLLAEDSAVNREYTLAILKNLGCTVDAVENGSEAVDAAASGGYDLILMDCEMPEMNGFEATRLIREAEAAMSPEVQAEGKTRPVPIIAQTATVLPGFREECLAHGMNDYLTKPYTQKNLRAALEPWLASQRLPGGNGTDRKNPRRPLPQRALEPAAEAPVSVSLDRNALDEIQQRIPDGDALLQRVLTLYRREGQSFLSVVRQGISADDMETLRQSAHKFKSTSGTIGAVRMSHLCRELERCAAAAETDRAARLLAELEEEYRNVERALSAEAARRGA